MRLISYPFLILIMSMTGCANLGASEDEPVTTKETIYPYNEFPEIMADYEHQIKVGYPNERGARIWVKGSEELDSVRLVSGMGSELDAASLSEPFCTHIFESLEAGKQVTVQFLADGRIEHTENVVTVGLEQLHSTNTDYSIVLYGCFQPFTLEGTASEPKSSLFQPEQLTTYLGRFSQISSGIDTYTANPIAPNVKLLVGSGDQVYMDAGYDAIPADGKHVHPLSAWTTTKAQPSLLRKRDYFPKHVELSYRAFGSFGALNTPLKKTPQVAVWDDHEIRDGWGSQRDENDLKDIFLAARDGYIDHQFGPSPGPGNKTVINDRIKVDTKTGNPYPLHQTFTVGHYEGFAFDLRTDRDATQQPTRVISPTQKEAFEVWLGELKDTQKILIISSMPVFLGNNDLEGVYARFNKETQDDIQDGWSKNPSDRMWLIQQLMEARLRGIMPVLVSGDYHKGALSEIWYGDEKERACGRSGETKKKVFGYEIIASGLFHEGMVRGKKAELFSRVEAQRIGKHFIKGIEAGGKSYCLDSHVEKSTVVENFGVLTDSNGDGNLDILKLVTMMPNELGVATLPMNWTKDFVPRDEKKYKGFWQKFSYWAGPPTKYFGPFSIDDKFTPLGTKTEVIPIKE